MQISTFGTVSLDDEVMNSVWTVIFRWLFSELRLFECFLFFVFFGRLIELASAQLGQLGGNRQQHFMDQPR